MRTKRSIADGSERSSGYRHTGPGSGGGFAEEILCLQQRSCDRVLAAMIVVGPVYGADGKFKRLDGAVGD